MTVVVTHTTPADSTFSSTGAAAWNADHTLAGVGTMAEQDKTSVDIEGGTIDNTVIGATTPAAGTFTTLTAQTEVLKGTGTNLLLQSNTFNTTWSNVQASVASGQSDPFGGSTAWTLTGDGSNNPHSSSQNIAFSSGVTYTYSFYFKKNTNNFVQLSFGAAVGTQFVNFNLDTGTVGTTSASTTGTITSVGNGWFRCSMTATATASSTAGCIVYLVTSASAARGEANTLTTSIFIYSAQLEVGSTVNTYIPTTTTAVYGTPTLSFSGVAGLGLQSDGSLYATSAGTGNVRFYTNNIGQEQFRVSHTASAVNYVQVTGAATGSPPAITAQGSDSNIRMNISSKGTESVDILTNNTGTRAARFAYTASAVNYLQAQGSIAGNGLQFSAQGSDTNISQVFQSKGTGAIDLAAGSSGVNISNGGTVTAITFTNAGTAAYSSIPSVAVSAPTTAGGVQATATAQMRASQSSTTLASGGTGYTAGDVLTLSGGTFTTASQITVNTVSAGVIATFSVTGIGSGYSVLPTNPVSVTGGTGSGATFNLAWGVNGFTITNAGSGYVEQPTVSFSGGGGSGAAAYAVVGATTTFRTIGHSGTVAMRFDVPSSLPNNVPTFRLIDSGTAQDSGFQILGGVTGVSANAFGAASANLGLFANGTGTVNIGSGGTGNLRQFAVSHTASAVNYVQVTGGATGVTPTISFQGSDGNIGGSFVAKGSNGTFRFLTNTTLEQLRILNTASAVNYATVTGSAASSGPVFSVAGTDTNIDLNLTTKGTGALKVNTGNGEQFRVADTFGSVAAVNYIKVQGRASGGPPFLTVDGSDTNPSLGLSSKGSGAVQLFTNSNATEQMRVSHTASAVNYVQVTGAATGVPPVISAQGSDTNIHLTLQSKGSNGVRLSTSGASNIQAFVSHTASAVNFLQLTGSAAGSSPVFSVAGSDTDIDLTLTPKGAGNVRFGTYTGTILTPTGYITIKDSGGTTRRLLVG
jgi:hypothetical protein